MKNAIKCNKCGSYINVDTGYIYTPCACGAIAVDGGKDYTRVIGNREDWTVIYPEEEGKN